MLQGKKKTFEKNSFWLYILVMHWLLSTLNSQKLHSGFIKVIPALKGTLSRRGLASAFLFSSWYNIPMPLLAFSSNGHQEINTRQEKEGFRIFHPLVFLSLGQHLP